MNKPNIEYPCTWSYKIIGSDRKLIPQNVRIILENYEYTFRPSKKSTTGKYVSFHCSVKVESEEERNRIFVMLQNIPTVKMVL